MPSGLQCQWTLSTRSPIPLPFSEHSFLHSLYLVHLVNVCVFCSNFFSLFSLLYFALVYLLVFVIILRATRKRTCTCASVTLGNVTARSEQTAKSRRLRRPTHTAGFLHVSGRLRDSGQLYQGLFAEGIYQPRSDTSHTLRQCVH